MSSPETIRDIMTHLMNHCQLSGEQRRSYEERIARAVWRDRGEWMRALEAADWSEGSEE